MATRRILATSGGFIPGPVQQSVRIGPMITEALLLTGKTRPKVAIVLTASGDDDIRYARYYEAFSHAGCDVTEMRVYLQPTAEPREHLASCDFVWVGGGSVANLLALWRLHGIDIAMREAWESGTILGGVSAGSICWHVGGPTDSFGQTLRPIPNALGMLPFGNGVHYDSEAQRRPLLHQLVADGTLPDSIATDDRVGVWYEGIEPVRVVRDVDLPTEEGPRAYFLTRRDDEAVETPLAPGPISLA